MNGQAKKSRRLISLSDVDRIEKMPKEYANSAKRQLRKPLLKAFDAHKASVIYGDATETEEEHRRVLAWKKKALDLETEAFKEVPKSVEYYL